MSGSEREGGISVLLVDDQPLLRKGFRMVPEEEPGMTVVGEASDGAAACELVARRDPMSS